MTDDGDYFRGRTWIIVSERTGINISEIIGITKREQSLEQSKDSAWEREYGLTWMRG